MINRNWAGLTSWNSSTERCRYRQWARSANPASSRTRSAARTSTSSRSTTALRAPAAPGTGRRPRPPVRPPASPVDPPRSAAGPYDSGVRQLALAQPISASTAEAVAGSPKRPVSVRYRCSATSGGGSAGSRACRRRRVRANWWSVPARTPGPGDATGRSRGGARARRTAPGAGPEFVGCLAGEGAHHMWSASADPSRMRRATRRVSTLVLPDRPRP